MDRYEYKVIPAPSKGLKAKGIKSPEDRFAYALETAMNELGIEGWEYWRAECLPATERAGLTSSKTVERHMFVFRRLLPMLEDAAPIRRTVVAPIPTPAPAPAPEPMPEPEPTAPVASPVASEDARTPVFTRRLEIAREQREAVLQRDDPNAEPPLSQDHPER